MKRKAVLVVAFLGLLTCPLAGQLTERLYQDACDDGGFRACQILGILYQTGEQGVTQDLGKAVILFQTACDGEMWESCHRLGVMYANGTGATQDLGQAVILFQQACDAEEAQSCSQLDLLTQMTIRPEILNRSEVQAALMREYPRNLRNDGVGGRVVVWLFISETGQVLDKRVSQTSGHEELDAAALEVADVFRFTPAWNRGEVVQVWIQLPITFGVVRRTRTESSSG